ncbi:4-alpha-glucanotransferase [Desulfovibrio sp. OttesenSCG-928-G11]|nr:4-alpha-glucanotransferase [Desulfovibrio sp. OttesenSCG-928-G11]
MKVLTRRYGVLLHISSLPSAWGIGDLGPAAHAFARELAAAGASLWQFLPLNPTSTFIGNSPYSSDSAFAGNSLFISPDFLLEDGWLSPPDLESCLRCLPRALARDPAAVDFEAVSAHRKHLLHAAFERNAHRLKGLESFQHFCDSQAGWLHDHARFVSLKKAHQGAAWFCWSRDLKMRDPAALAAWDQKAALDILHEKFIQFLFYSQWMRLKKTCAELGVLLLADVPIYVTHDSVDVWSNPQYFNLDANMMPLTVSGVPPDYFSATGQRWGNPVYRWEVMAADSFAWWKRRLDHVLNMADMARLDHFRGFCAFWEIPAEEKTAVNGQWRKAPARELFSSLRDHFGALPFLAEDLGVITDDVREIMADFHLPGMHVLQFAFGGQDTGHNSNIPHLHSASSFVYTGTHDNAPSRAWFAAAPAHEKENLRRYTNLALDEQEVAGQLTRMAFASVAECAVVPMQDVLQLGDEGRMNCPGIASGNWNWRLLPEQARPGVFDRLEELARIYGRRKSTAQKPLPPDPISS